MKLISWNVNGLRACVGKGFLDYFHAENADCFCLQETKLQAGQIELDLPAYKDYWNYAEKKGYSGTAIFTKQEPLNVSYGIGVEELDNEGRVVTLEFEKFYLVTCYTPQRFPRRVPEHQIPLSKVDADCPFLQRSYLLIQLRWCPAQSLL